MKSSLVCFLNATHIPVPSSVSSETTKETEQEYANKQNRLKESRINISVIKNNLKEVFN